MDTLTALYAIGGWVMALIVEVVWYRQYKKMVAEWYERCEQINAHWHDLCMELIDEGADRKTENSSEKPNNCEHITEDGVTCAKYPACDDCPDNSLSKVKGSERLVKGKVEPTISKMEQVDKDINVRSKDEPQTDCAWK